MNDDTLTAEDIASAGAIPWSELPSEAQERFGAWWVDDEYGRLVAKAASSPEYRPAGFDHDYALWLTGSVLRCGMQLDIEGADPRAEYDEYRRAVDDPTKPHNLFRTLAEAVAEFDDAPPGIAGEERNEAAIAMRDAAAALLATVTAAGCTELWWRDAVVHRIPAESAAADASDFYCLSVFGVEVTVRVRREGRTTIPHVQVGTDWLPERRVIVQVDDEREVTFDTPN